MGSVWLRSLDKCQLYGLLILVASVPGVRPSAEDNAIRETGELLVLTVATQATDGFQRFLKSADRHGLNVTVLGMGDMWRGGDLACCQGGGQKVSLLRAALQTLTSDYDGLVMVVDSYDVVFVGGATELVKAFQKLDANVVFSAESFCWPNPALAERYPAVKTNEMRYLNSGGFIGYIAQIREIVNSSQIDDRDDDQLFYTKVFLDEEKRTKLGIKLDTRGSIFQTVNGALDNLTVKFKGSSGYVYNKNTGNSPLVVHGNGPIKVEFNSLTNYITDHWTPRTGCIGCKENTISLNGIRVEDMPLIFFAIFIEYPTAFLEEFFHRVDELNYPKTRIVMLIHYAVEFHRTHVEHFINRTRSKYRRVTVLDPSSELDDWTARNEAVKHFAKSSCQYFFSLDGDGHLENRNTLRHLVETNRSVVAAMMTRHGRVWSNFWGAVSENGFYKRSNDYMDIIHRKQKGIWNVPYIASVYLIHGHRMSLLDDSYIDDDLDADMAFCKHLRTLGVFMYVDNQFYYGHLVNSAHYETSHVHNDLYSIFDNPYTWEKKYLSPEYYRVLHNVSVVDVEQPCPDVFWLPLVSSKFCQDMIEEMENNGEWSHGAHSDPRIIGGYENVPTVDIHTRQIGWEKHWLHFLHKYILPLSAKVYEGYQSEGKALMNFVVRYRPNDQDRLAAHSDYSTFTVNIALNTPGVDYEGGGTLFIRYDCRVTKSRLGWMLMHPGKLTHHHEGLPVTNGTRYIMVSFIDP